MQSNAMPGGGESPESNYLKNLRRAIKLARYYLQEFYGDAETVGHDALVEALAIYDPSRRVPFANYLRKCVRWRCLDWVRQRLRELSRTISIEELQMLNPEPGHQPPELISNAPSPY